MIPPESFREKDFEYFKSILRSAIIFDRKLKSREITTSLLERIDKVNSLEYIQYKSLSNMIDSVLHDSLKTAIKVGNSECVNLHLDKGIDVDTKCSSGYSLLHIAVLATNYEVVKLLLDRGACVDIENNEGDSPLKLAAMFCHSYQFVKLLVERGACIDKKDHFGMTPLFHAVAFNSIDSIIYLAIKGAEISENVLEEAAKNQRKDILEFLKKSKNRAQLKSYCESIRTSQNNHLSSEEPQINDTANNKEKILSKFIRSLRDFIASAFESLKSCFKRFFRKTSNNKYNTRNLPPPSKKPIDSSASEVIKSDNPESRSSFSTDPVSCENDPSCENNLKKTIKSCIII